MLTPENDIDQERWTHTRLRQNIIGGTWEQEVLDVLRTHYGVQGITTMGKPSTAINLLANVTDQTAVLYDTPSLITNPAMEPASIAVWDDIMDKAHWGSIAQENCRKVVCLREGFIHVMATDVGIQFEVVTPSTIVVEQTTGDASQITALKRARTFMYAETPGGKVEPHDCWECWDISEPSAPVHQVIDGAGKIVTQDAIPDEPGFYVWQDADGPYLPMVFYRARYTSQTFDPFFGNEIVAGTLECAVHWTMHSVAIRNCSWPVNWISDGDVPGTNITGDGTVPFGGSAPPAASIELTPNSILRFTSTGAPGTMKIGNFPAADAKAMGETILQKQNTILANIGISPDDLSTTRGPESGYAIQLKASAKRRVALSYVPCFRDADLKLFATIARIHNTFYANEGVPMLPTDGWRIDYNLPEKSVDEFLVELAKNMDLISLGLMSLVDVAMAYYDLKDPNEAIAKLNQIKQMNALVPVDPAAVLQLGSNTTRRSGATS